MIGTARLWLTLLLAIAVAQHAPGDEQPVVASLYLDFNVPLWQEGKVPGAKGDWSVDNPI